MNKMILTIGIPGAGKTTWAESFIKDNSTYVNINRDDIRKTLYPLGYTFSKEREKEVTKYQHSVIKHCIDNNKSIIISDTNLNSKTREDLKSVCNENNYKIEYKEFPISYEEAIERNIKRGENSVPNNVIFQMYKSWNNYINKKVYSPDLQLPKAIIIDIDGTVADKGSRNAFDYSKVKEDSPRVTVIDLLTSYIKLKNIQPIFVSGREDWCKALTLEWLEKYLNIPQKDIILHMRKSEDFRKDTIIKEEIFWEHIADNYNVLAAFDDRQCVVEMWYDIKIPTVFNVSDSRCRF